MNGNLPGQDGYFDVMNAYVGSAKAAPHVCSPGSSVGIRVNRSTKAGDIILAL